MKTGFFFHLSSETLIRHDWDLDTDPREFFLTLPEEVRKGQVYSLQELEVTEEDISLAATGVATDAFKAFFNRVWSRVKERPGDMVVVQSMHSGSSDYLFVRDVEIMVESWKS